MLKMLIVYDENGETLHHRKHKRLSPINKRERRKVEFKLAGYQCADLFTIKRVDECFVIPQVEH